MPTFGIKIDEFKSMFFDRKHIQRQMRDVAKKQLQNAGKEIRTNARKSIKGRKALKYRGTKQENKRDARGKFIGYGHLKQAWQMAEAGKPPFSHRKDSIRKIFYGWDNNSRSVVIGPIGFSGSHVPEVLEYGGITTVTSNMFYHHKKGSKIRLKPHPFMGPAYKKEEPNLPKRWQNAI